MFGKLSLQIYVVIGLICLLALPANSQNIAQSLGLRILWEEQMKNITQGLQEAREVVVIEKLPFWELIEELKKQ